MTTPEAWTNKGLRDQFAELAVHVSGGGELDQRYAFALIRSAYGQGYVDALSESGPLPIEMAERAYAQLLADLPTT